MFIARWKIDARFGQKAELIALMRQWERDIGSRVGLDPMEAGLLTGSIGALEATVEHNHRVGTLAELEAAFAKLAEIPEHAAWGRSLEPHVVSGTARWEIFRQL